MSHLKTEDSTLNNFLYSWYIMLQRPCGKNNTPESGFSDGRETSSNTAFDMCNFEFGYCRVGLMEFSNGAAQDGHHVLEVFELDNVFDCVANKMYYIGQVEYCWNIIDKKFTKQSSIPSA